MAEEENFSAEDLALLNPADTDAGATTGTPSEPAGDGKQGDAGTTNQDATGDKTGVTKEPPATILDDFDKDAGDGDKAGDDKANDGKANDGKDADKSADKDARTEPAKWREEFADRLLAQIKDKIPEGKLDARRAAILNQLNRYKSAEDYMIAGFAAQERIRSGEMRSKLPADASEDEIAAWRAENGIPAEAKDYDVPKIPGYKWTDADKPLIDSFKEYAHKGNYTPEQMATAAEWYVNTVQKQQEQWAETIKTVDRDDFELAKEKLRAEWGADYKPMVALLQRGLNDRQLLSEDDALSILNGRFTDAKGVSRRIINQPGVATLLTNYFHDTYGEGALIRGDGRPNPSNVIEEGEKIMNDDLDRYYREGWDQKVLEARQQQEGGGRRRRAA